MNCASTNKFTLGTCIRLIVVLGLITLVVWYVLFQARNFLEGPMVTLADTSDVLHHERFIPLTGTAHNIVRLTLNGKEIHTNERGEFAHTLVLETGYTIMTLEAHDRFGRKSSLVREYVYTPL